MINGVLTERTVSDVLPALQTNADGLKKVLEDLVKQYRSKQDEMEKWKVCDATLVSPKNFGIDSRTEEAQYPGCAAVKWARLLIYESKDPDRFGAIWSVAWGARLEWIWLVFPSERV